MYLVMKLPLNLYTIYSTKPSWLKVQTRSELKTSPRFLLIYISTLYGYPI